MTIVKENSPHLRKKASVTRMMVDVLVALAPTLIFAFIIFPIQTLYTYLISLFVMVGSEFVYVGLRNMMPNDGMKHSFKERFTYAYKGHFNQNNILTACITAVIYTLITPPTATIYAIIIGAFAGIILGKLLFGGLGSNIFNPAAVGMVFAKLCFGNQYAPYSSLKPSFNFYTIPDVAAGATPLGTINNYAFGNLNQYSLSNLFFGQIPGTLGEVYTITILIGLVYLLVRRSADYRIVVSYLGSFALFALVAGLSIFMVDKVTNPFVFMLYSLLSGGVLFGGVFMLTDPVTSPINSPSRWMYGIIAAIGTIFIRLFAALPEGVAFSILIANMFAAVLDHYEWSSSRYTWKKLLTIGLLVVIPTLIIFLIIGFGGVYHA